MTTSVSPTTEPTATMASAGSLKGKDMTIIGGDYDGFVQAVDLVAEGEGNIVPYTSSPRDGYYIVIPVRGFGGDLPVRAVDSAAANPRLNRAIRLHLLRLTRDDLLVNPPLPITILSLDALEHIVRHRQWITCRFTGIDIDLFTAYPVIRPSSNARDSARQHHALPDARHIHEAASFSEDIQRRINIALARRRDEANVKFSTRTPRAAGTAKKRSRPNVELDRAGNEPPPEQTTGKRYIASTIRVRRRPYPIDSSLTAEEAPNVETEGMASPEPEPKRFKVIPYEPAPLLPVEEIRQTYTFLDLDSSQVFVVGALVVFAYLFGKDAGAADCRAACSQINLSSALTALRGATEAAARYSGGAL